MDAGQLLRMYIKLLEETDLLITDLLETAWQLQKEGRVDELPRALQEGLTAMRHSSVVRKARARKSRPPRKEELADVFPQNGVPQFELHRQLRSGGKPVRLLIPGRDAMWISSERAALIEALAEPIGFSDDKLVAFKTVPQLARRIGELTRAPIKNHTVISSLGRLREWLAADAKLLQKRPADATRGIVTGYRFALLADGKILKHPPDCGATGAATDGDR